MRNSDVTSPLVIPHLYIHIDIDRYRYFENNMNLL